MQLTYFSPGCQLASWVDWRRGWAREFQNLVPANVLKYKLLFLLELKHSNTPSSVDVRQEKSLYNTRRRFGDLQSSIFAEEQRQKHHKWKSVRWRHAKQSRIKSETVWQKNTTLHVMFHLPFPGMWWQVMYKIKSPPSQSFFEAEAGYDY